MADKKAGSAFHVPVYTAMPSAASKVAGVPFAPHYLDGAPIEEVDTIRVVGDAEIGVQSVSVASDFNSAIDLPAASGTRHKIAGGGSPTASLVAGDARGLVRVTTGAVAGNDAIIVYNGADQPIPAATSGKRAWLTASVQVVDGLTDGAVLIGLAPNNVVDMDAEPVDGLYFYKANAASDFKVVARKNSASTTIVSAVYAAAGKTLDTNLHEYSVHINEAGGIHVYLDGVLVGLLGAGDANIPYTPTGNPLTLVIGRSTQSAAARNLQVDYYLVGQEV